MTVIVTISLALGNTLAASGAADASLRFSLPLSRSHTHTNTHTNELTHARTLPYHFSFPFDRHPRLLTLRRYSHVMFEMKMNVFRIAINTAAIRLRRARFSPTFAPLSSSRSKRDAMLPLTRVIRIAAHPRVTVYPFARSVLSQLSFLFFSFLLFFFFFSFVSRSKDPRMHTPTNEVRF